MGKPIGEYVKHDLDIFRTECNFSDEELDYFNCKAKKYNDYRTASEMCVSSSTVRRLKDKVEEKMERVIELYFNDNN